MKEVDLESTVMDYFTFFGVLGVVLFGVLDEAFAEVFVAAFGPRPLEDLAVPVLGSQLTRFSS